MVRKPVVAGMFYEKDFDRLSKELKNCFIKSPGPGELPKESNNKSVYGAIIPHAGYVYSGYCAAHAYKEIAEASFPDVFILIGPNHTGIGENSILTEDMLTPIGEVSIDLDFAKELSRESGLSTDKLSHLREHSLEVHLPFLQFIAKENIKRLKIVPIVVYECNTKKIAESIKNTAQKQNKKVCIIASSDFIHYGFNYDYVPFSDNVKENITKYDLEAYSFIEQKDSAGFLNYVDKTDATICGKYPIAILLDAVNGKAELLCHYNSGDISGEHNNCVDYMSVVFR